MRPKVLCPVGDAPLLDHALQRFDGVTAALAVNAHHHARQLEAHLERRVGDRVHLSLEDPVALGTAGALGALRGWIDGRPCLVANGDTWCPTSLRRLVEGWDGERIRVLSPSPGPLGPTTRVAGALLAWADVAGLLAEPAGLYEASWAPAAEAGRVEVVPLDADDRFFDCGTPADYLRANLAWSGGTSVVGAGAEVAGMLERSVVWPDAVVRAREHLVAAIRTNTQVTVLIR